MSREIYVLMVHRLGDRVPVTWYFADEYEFARALMRLADKPWFRVISQGIEYIDTAHTFDKWLEGE